jgi:Flp pilus assembly protein TadD
MAKSRNISAKSPKRRAGPSKPQQRVADESARNRNRHLLVALALCFVTLLAYSNSFSAGFVLDNKPLLLQDPRIHEATGRNIDLIFRHTYWWPTGEAGLYRPLTTLSYLLNYAIHENRDVPAGYHWINLILHTGNVLLVYLVSRRLIRSFWPPVFIAALWAVHPAGTESVTNIVGRADLLAAGAVLGGFLIYLRSNSSAGWRRVAWLLALAAITAAGVFSKESAVTVLGVVALCELTWRKERGRGRALILGCAAMLLPTAVMLYQRSVVLARSPAAEFPFTDNPIAGADFWIGHLTALKVMSRYLSLAAWPRLSCDYSYSQIPLATGSAGDWIAWIIVAAAAAGVVMLYRWNRTAFFFSAFSFITFLPTSNLLFPIGTIMADRLIYLPLVGLLACLVMAIYTGAHRVGKPAIAPVLLCLIAAAFTFRTWARNGDLKDDLTLATADVRTSPNSFKIHRMLATALFEADPAHSNIDRVIEETDRSMAIIDSLPDLRNQPGVYQLAGAAHLAKSDLLRQHGQGAVTPESAAADQKARRFLLRCVSINEAYDRQFRSAHGKPAFGVIHRSEPDAYRLLSISYMRSGDLDEAETAANNARTLAPLDPNTYRQLSHVLLARNRGNEAAMVLMTGMLITSDPNVRAELIELYGSSQDPENCTLVSTPGGPAINPQCGIVRDHLCAAAVTVIRVRLEGGRRDLAERDKQTFVTNYGCPAAPLDRAIASGPGN